MKSDVAVECYSGSRYAERPSAVHWQGQRLPIEQVERAWRTPAGPVFQVVATGCRRMQLALDERSDTWTVVELPLIAASSGGNP